MSGRSFKKKTIVVVIKVPIVLCFHLEFDERYQKRHKGTNKYLKNSDKQQNMKTSGQESHTEIKDDKILIGYISSTKKNTGAHLDTF